MPDKKREINPRSLHKSKVRVNLTLLPETIQWLKEEGQGNASDMVDQLVASARSGKMKSIHPDPALWLEINQLRSRLIEIRTEVSEIEEKLERLIAELQK